jgi:hypothetical protein
VRQTRRWSLPASASVVGCKTPWKAARVRSSSLWVPSGRFDRASDSPCTTSRAPSGTVRQLLPALRVFACRCSRSLTSDLRPTGRFVVVRLRSLSLLLRSGRHRRQRWWQPFASRELSGVHVFEEHDSSGVGGSPRGGHRASALCQGLCRRSSPSGELGHAHFQVGSELANDSEREQRRGGNTSEQLDRVSGTRSPER